MTETQRIFEEDGVMYYEDLSRNIRINLTEMYGKGREPRTVEAFMRMFPPLTYPKAR